jgi:hypothetical protein
METKDGGVEEGKEEGKEGKEGGGGTWEPVVDSALT